MNWVQFRYACTNLWGWPATCLTNLSLKQMNKTKLWIKFKLLQFQMLVTLYSRNPLKLKHYVIAFRNPLNAICYSGGSGGYLRWLMSSLLSRPLYTVQCSVHKFWTDYDPNVEIKHYLISLSLNGYILSCRLICEQGEFRISSRWLQRYLQGVATKLRTIPFLSAFFCFSTQHY